MKMQDIKSALLGKKISYYNGFSGTSAWFTIGFVKNESESIRVFEERDKGFGVFIPKKQLQSLIELGYISNRGEIDGCSFQESWKLCSA